ncbi:MAG: glycerophosphodiester phosphodiesterase [Pseudonocardiales bacterium]|nr:glycerophosphodiester phosphodiesterase [Pseudonocardiales bacterium]
MVGILVVLACLTVTMASSASGARGNTGPDRIDPLVIGHRGAAGYRPEHTLASYELAARLGADYIEPDLVSTKDGVLVARHEPEISQTTDVAQHPEFTGRKTTKVIDGQPLTGWFTEDFTLAELKTLRAVERIPAVRQRNTIYNGRYQVPTFGEVIALRQRLSKELGREIGIYPETKHPSYYRSVDLPLEPELVDALNRAGLNRPGAPVFVQSFEVGNLQALHSQLRVPLIQLIDSTGAPADFVAAGDMRTYSDLLTPAGLAAIARYAAGIGPAKDRIVPRDAAGFSQQPTSLVRDAHAAGLLVHPFTFRNENQFLPAEARSSGDPNAYGDAFAEYQQFYTLGVDGVFSDMPDTAVAARTESLPAQRDAA